MQSHHCLCKIYISNKGKESVDGNKKPSAGTLGEASPQASKHERKSMYPTPTAPNQTNQPDPRDQIAQERDLEQEQLERAAEPYLNLDPAATTAHLLAALRIDTKLSAERFKTAYSGSYFDPERVGASHRAGHIAFFEQARDKLSQAADTPERERVALRLLESFREGYVKRIESQLSSESRFYSWHISGPSRYPSRRMAQRRDVAGRKQSEMLEWREQRVRRMLRIIAGVGRTRTTRLEEIKHKLEACEARQTLMKAANAIMRKHHYQDSPELRAALEPHGLRGLIVTKLLEPDCCKRRGFPDYEISNNGAQLRRWKKELEAEQSRLQRAELQPQTERTINGVRVEEHLEDDRLRLYFPTKPDAQTIKKLKGDGWKWSPSNLAWQRQLTNHARYSAEHVILNDYAAEE